MRLRTGGVVSTLVAGSGDLSAGTWAFVAAVYDGGHMILYKDGVEVGRMAKSGSINTNSSASVWVAGTPTLATNRPWKGWLDEVAVLSRDLSAAEIAQLFAARVPSVNILSWND